MAGVPPVTSKPSPAASGPRSSHSGATAAKKTTPSSARPASSPAQSTAKTTRPTSSSAQPARSTTDAWDAALRAAHDASPHKLASAGVAETPRNSGMPSFGEPSVFFSGAGGGQPHPEVLRQLAASPPPETKSPPDAAGSSAAKEYVQIARRLDCTEQPTVTLGFDALPPRRYRHRRDRRRGHRHLDVVQGHGRPARVLDLPGTDHGRFRADWNASRTACGSTGSTMTKTKRKVCPRSDGVWICTLV